MTHSSNHNHPYTFCITSKDEFHLCGVYRTIGDVSKIIIVGKMHVVKNTQAKNFNKSINRPSFDGDDADKVTEFMVTHQLGLNCVIYNEK